jgi:aldose sugar dehydrogenase
VKKKIFLIIFIILASIFTGYENPKLVEDPKKYINYFLKKIGIVESFIVSKNKETDEVQKKENSLEFFANSFTLELKKIRTMKGKTASVIFDKNLNYRIFTQSGSDLTKNKIEEMNLPIDFTLENEGGVKSVIYMNEKYFALISRKTFGCYHATLIELDKQKVILDSKCIKDDENINFAGLGGGYVIKDNNLLLSVGTPTHNSDDIDLLAQKEDSIFGKILEFKESDLKKNTQVNYKIFSSGHRNPQGLVLIEKNIYSTEHGPQGGDELNKIERNKNYGWPVASLGTRYGGSSFKRNHSKSNFVEPIFSFLPSIAPSALTSCPLNLKNYYDGYTCLMGLTLREMSLMIYLIDETKNKLVSFEKIPIDKRLRHFGLNQDGTLHQDKTSFYISSDKDGLYKIKFKDFR